MVSQRAAQLRSDFDRSFAAPPRAPSAAPVDLLAIRLGEQPYALRLAEIAGLFADKKLTRLPQSVPAFLGIAGFRRSVVPVYDLSVLLGDPGAASPRWLVIAAAGAFALAFDSFDGYLRLAPEDIAQPEHSAAARPHLRGLASAAGGLRPIVDLASILQAIELRAHGLVPPPLE